jgi:hypothetical protein
VIGRNGGHRSMQAMRTERIWGLPSISDGLRLGPPLKPQSSGGWVNSPQDKRQGAQGLWLPGIFSGLEGALRCKELLLTWLTACLIPNTGRSSGARR